MATKTISAEHRLELLSKLCAHTDWDSLDPAVTQEIIDHPGNPGQQFTVFLKNGGRVNIGDLKIAPAPFDPVKFIGEGWKTLAEEHDDRNDSLTEVDFNKVDFPTCLADGETSVTGEEKLKRLKALQQIRYGATIFMGLWNDYQARKDNSVLETLFPTKNIAYIDFFGDVLLSSRGGRRVLCLCRCDDGQWRWSFRWLVDDWRARGRSAVSSQVSAQVSVPVVS